MLFPVDLSKYDDDNAEHVLDSMCAHLHINRIRTLMQTSAHLPVKTKLSEADKNRRTLSVCDIFLLANFCEYFIIQMQHV